MTSRTVPTGAGPLACNPTALSPDTWRTHVARSARLFATVGETRDLPDGYAFRFTGDQHEEVEQYVANEQKCCPFLAFAIEVAADGEVVWLQISGPEGTRELLECAVNQAQE